MKIQIFLAGCVLALSATQVQAQATAEKKRPASEIPMYGNPDKPKQLSKKDEAFIASLEKSGKTRQEEAKNVLQVAWQYFQQRKYAQSIRRFNQAWLLDQENGDVYHGFAVISVVRDHLDLDAERYFRLALSKPGVNVNAYVDFGRFLWIGKRYDESIVQLEKALSISPKAHNARSNLAMVYYKKADFAKACVLGREAKKNHDVIAKDFLEEMCKRVPKV